MAKVSWKAATGNQANNSATFTYEVETPYGPATITSHLGMYPKTAEERRERYRGAIRYLAEALTEYAASGEVPE